MVPPIASQTTGGLSSTIPTAAGAGGLVGAGGVIPGMAMATTAESSTTSAAATATGVAGSSSGSTEPDPTEAAAAATEETRQALEKKLEELIQNLLELSITVYDFQSESNSLVHQKISDIIQQLKAIEEYKDTLDMVVPWEVLSYIEDGKNPDLFSKTFVEAVAGENQFTNGKITAMKASLSDATLFLLVSFEAALAQNLGDAFPEDMIDYNEILKEVSAAPGQTTTSASAPAQ
ncbi:Mediator of RNA polymerase II transcription subunit 10 [Mortierella sp. GBA35]|nr:Mediator of RNA polymerase II transcription subunit 10 [Mortierella sp. GBA35]